MGFTCSVCGQYHDEQLLDIRAGLPDAVFALDGPERDARAEIGDDWCVLDEERFFVRGLIELPIPPLGQDFRFGAWVEVAPDDFTRVGELWHDPRGRRHPPFAATLANELKPYTGTAGLPVLLRLEEVERLPSIEVLDGEHALGRDQREGVDEPAVHRLAATVLH
jgi:hypothetical protein